MNMKQKGEKNRFFSVVSVFYGRIILFIFSMYDRSLNTIAVKRR